MRGRRPPCITFVIHSAPPGAQAPRRLGAAPALGRAWIGADGGRSCLPSARCRPLYLSLPAALSCGRRRADVGAVAVGRICCLPSRGRRRPAGGPARRAHCRGAVGVGARLMGPRPGGRGRMAAAMKAVISIMLQWGRNLSVAEGLLCAGLRDLVVDASMGPQPFGCGRRPRRRPACRRSCRFNGAATFRLRKGP